MTIKNYLTSASQIYDKAIRYITPPDKVAVKQKKISGFNILCLANEDVGRRIYFYGKYDERETEFLRNAIKKDWVCFDIGANVGYYTLLLASLAKNGQVHAFEPIPLYYHLLSGSIAINKMTNIRLNNCAVGNINGSLDFFVPEDGAFASFVDTKRRRIKEMLAVKAKKLDDYAKESNIRKVDFIKIDVEGAEKLVLEGAVKILSDKNTQPKFLLLELYDSNFKQYNTSIENIVDYLFRYDYLPMVIEQEKLVSFEKKHYNKEVNIFFVKR